MNSQIGKSNKKLLIGIVAIVIIVVASVGGYVVLSMPKTNLPAMTLTVVGADGQQKVLNQNDIAALEAYTQNGGFKSSGGVIAAVGEYKGVPILTLCDLVGGITNEHTLTVTASDGYSMVYTYNQVNGEGYITYDPTTGSERAPTQPMKMVATYFKDGEALPSEQGPLRIGILGPEGLLTEGHFWTKMVSKLEITSGIRDWTVTVKATTNLNMDRQSYTADYNHFGINYTDSSDNVWTGTALWRWVSWSNYNGGVSNASLDKGYSVKLISGDGSSATFDDSQVKLNDKIILASHLNGEILSAPYWPLTAVGADVPSAKSVKNIVEIQIILDSQPSATPSPSASPSPTASAQPTPTPTATPTPLPDMELTLVAANGTQLVLDEEDMAELTAVTYNGGTRNSKGVLGNYGAYTGVPINTLLDLVGGVTSSQTVRATSSDEYTTTYTYEQLNGQGIATYDSNGTAVTPAPTQLLKMIVAYYLNGTAIPSDAGPLRIITVGPEGLYTSGNISAKMVVKIEILNPT